MLPEVILTERLRLEPRTPEFVDTLSVYEHCREGAPHIDEVTEHLPWEPHPHPKETRDFLQRGAEAREEASAAAYVIRPREGEDGAGEIAGFGGLNLDWDRGRGGLGIWLRKRFWGRGYSGERAHALVALAFGHLDLEVVAVGHVPENEQSGRAIQRYIDEMGGRREGTIRNSLAAAQGPPRDEVRYAVSQAEWREADPDPPVTFYDDAADAPPRPDGAGPAATAESDP